MPSPKSQLRATLRQNRDEFVAGLSEHDRRLCFSCPPSPLAQLMENAQCVAGYITLGSEADPRLLLRAAREAGCAIALPHITTKAQPMRFLTHDGDEPLEPGSFGLLQPKASNAVAFPDLVLVPLVGFDREGNRLGQGAGHYDRALSILPNALRIGLAWSIQEIEHLPTDPWDEPLHAICTEKEWIIP